MINEILNINCLDFIPNIPDEFLDAVIIDPPYGEYMGYEGDNGLSEAESLLYSFLKNIEPKLKRNKHIAIFWTMRNLDSCIDAVRSCGFTYRRTLSMYLPKGNARPYLGWLPRTQAIVICQRYLPKKSSEFHTDLTEYLNHYISKSNLTRSQIAKELNCNSRLIMKWTRVNDPSWCLPTPRFYKPLKDILKLDDKFDILLTRQPVNKEKIDFDYKHDTYIVDNKNEEMLHPSQKPIKVIEHIVTCLTKEKEIIFDGFGGSGTTALACKNTNRDFIITELSKEYCDIIKRRL